MHVSGSLVGWVAQERIAMGNILLVGCAYKRWIEAKKDDNGAQSARAEACNSRAIATLSIAGPFGVRPVKERCFAEPIGPSSCLLVLFAGLKLAAPIALALRAVPVGQEFAQAAQRIFQSPKVVLGPTPLVAWLLG